MVTNIDQAKVTKPVIDGSQSFSMALTRGIFGVEIIEVDRGNRRRF